MIDNALSEYWYALDKDSPGKTWFYAAAWHPAIYRALKIDPEDPAAPYAAAPFRIARIEGKALILAAHPCPRMLGPIDEDWLTVETVIAWNPVTDRAFVLGDDHPQLVGTLTDEANVIHASAFQFARAWVEKRAAFLTQWKRARDQAWQTCPTERDDLPGALMIGTPSAIRWNPSALPENITVIGARSGEVNKAIFKAARLPRISERAS